MRLSAVLVPVTFVLCGILPWVFFFPFAQWAWFMVGLVTVLVLVAVVAVRFRTFAEDRRREALSQVATELDCAFHPDGDALLALLSDLPLFQRRPGSQIENVLCKRIEETEVFLCEHSFLVGGGIHQYLYRHTVAAFQVPSCRSFPEFALRPTGFSRRLISLLAGRCGVEFNEHPRFSRKYVLTGDDAPALRRLFGAESLGFFEHEADWCVGARGRCLLVYRPSHTRFSRSDWRLNRVQLASFLAAVSTILTLFAPALDG